MYNQATRIYSLLQRIEEAISLIQNQTVKIESPNDFLNSQSGMFILGGVCMQLIFIGESVKVIDAKDPGYLEKYSYIPWTEIMGLRDIIAHEYHRIDAEEIFDVIKKDLPSLLLTIRKMQKEIG